MAAPNVRLVCLVNIATGKFRSRNFDIFQTHCSTFEIHKSIILAFFFYQNTKRLVNYTGYTILLLGLKLHFTPGIYFRIELRESPANKIGLEIGNK